jgi:K+-sensing histidine kinase KdpD
MVDVTPRALLNRLERGVVYSRGRTERALQNFFREPTLVALLQLALRQTAHEWSFGIRPTILTTPRFVPRGYSSGSGFRCM